ncbi:carboxypeptidase regulatory-like domain-containing protein [Planctomicrobium piriforme]|uniref:carboxypeptidase regulatory-like domain-containing protein n=1 Tax=Planctomicrobium piriforme TaxID=1576369 RepID=UPI001113D0B7|nr:carboxypeptidase regulatory-like domain-containing protein [Planctomicrobium piriforme]
MAGKVTLDGTPLAAGMIQFMSAPGAKHSLVSGTSIKDGSYKLPPSGGLPPGSYSVTISSSPPPPPPPSDPNEAMKAAAEMKPAKELIPEKYNLKTELTVEVKKSGETEANFELKSGS